MDNSGKRKAAGDGEGASAFKKKKKKGGNQGKWTTPKQREFNRPQADQIEIGDMGIWVTCARSMKGKAAREVQLLFDHYAEKMYGIKPAGDVGNSDDDEEEDIESAIKKEIGALKETGKRSAGHVFTEIRIREECLIFWRCKAPIEPVEFVRRICMDAASNEGSNGLRTRYINRLTPVTLVAKANESSLETLARNILPSHFNLNPKEPKAESSDEKTEPKEEEVVGGKAAPAAYAIRPTARANNTLKRNDVIKRLADLVDNEHKVNLDNPDKVILVEIYQQVCGMSVVPGDWDKLKRFNLTELYNHKTKSNPKNGNKAEDGRNDTTEDSKPEAIRAEESAVPTTATTATNEDA